jgi:hypothetical protein
MVLISLFGLSRFGKMDTLPEAFHEINDVIRNFGTTGGIGRLPGIALLGRSSRASSSPYFETEQYLVTKREPS